jgi:hypothetical protein
MKKSGDTLVFSPIKWVFNFFRKERNRVPCYDSLNYKIQTTTLSDYWAELGKKDALIEVLKSRNKGVSGRSIESLALQVAVSEYGSGTILIIYNFDMSQIKRISERTSIDPKVFDSDVIFIPCNSITHAEKLKSLLPESMAYTMIVDHKVGYVTTSLI